MGIINVLLLRL